MKPVKYPSADLLRVRDQVRALFIIELWILWNRPGAVYLDWKN